MLRRLIIAVFVLGLVLALSGTAISDVFKEGMTPIEKINPSNPRFESVVHGGPVQPSFKKPASALNQLPPGMYPTAPPLDYYYGVQDYTNGVPFYGWSIPDAYGDDLFNMRFTAQANYSCSLYYAHFLMNGDGMTGTPDMRVYLWDDDGFGFPGVKIDSVDIPNALLPTSGLAWVTADFSTANAGLPYVFEDGEQYHYGFTIANPMPGDTLSVVSDDGSGPFAGEERSIEYYSGTWGTMLNDWGIDVSFFILSERACGEIPYTDCYWNSSWQNLAYIWAAPHYTYGDSAYAQRYSVGGPETVMFVDAYIYNAGNGTFGDDDVNITLYDDAAGLPGAPIATQTMLAGSYINGWNAFTFNQIVTGTFHVAFSSSATVNYEYCVSSDGSWCGWFILYI
jgi:hypothetical protein